MLIRKLELILSFDQLTTHPNGEFSYFSRRIEFNLDSRFIFDECRHPGSKKSIMKSNFTETYGYLFQWITLPFILFSSFHLDTVKVNAFRFLFSFLFLFATAPASNSCAEIVAPNLLIPPLLLLS